MFEKPVENPDIKTEDEIKEGAEKGPDFDVEAEKEHRKEIKKLLYKELSGVLKENGMEKIGNSLWQIKTGDSMQLLYLQRSMYSHSYYIEAGICDEKDIPEGEKPHIVYCRKARERIEYIVSEIEKERMPESENKEKGTRDKINKVNAALDFEIPGGLEKYPNEYYFPSVDIEKAKEKIDTIQKTVGEYVPLWFEKHSKPK